MYLTYRLAEPSDIEVCYPFVRARLGYSPELSKDFIAFGKELIKSGSCITPVWEDRDRPKGRRQIAIGESFFAADWLLNEIKTTLPPFLPLRLLEKWRDGKRLYLNKDKVLKANSGEGLSIVALHWGIDAAYRGEDYLKIMEVMSQSYQKILCEYRLKEHLEEVYGEYERDRFLSFGAKVQRDYREFTDTKFLSKPIGKGHPYLMGAFFPQVKEEGKNLETVVGRLALLGPPRFHFRLKEQEILKLALKGQTDEEMAKALNLSVVTVKKRWLLIYDKVISKDPELFTEYAGTDSEPDKVKQKRRILVKLLQEHPEELWPN